MHKKTLQEEKKKNVQLGKWDFTLFSFLFSIFQWFLKE